MKYIKIFGLCFSVALSFALVLVSPKVSLAAVSTSQNITLNPGWNIVSTPKILDSFSFSVANDSTNFDIYALNPSSPSGWSTLAELGQIKFTPLYGYFINNKTDTDQTLTFNYLADTTPNERLFERTFPTTGWYSIGVANPSYAKSVGAGSTDTNNPDHILNSLVDSIANYGTVIDFTDALFTSNKNSVALTDPWKAIERSADITNTTEINSLNDFRETKGYAIYIKQPNALYNGFQNDGTVGTHTQSNVVITKDTSSPDAGTLEVDNTISTTQTIAVFRASTNQDGGNVKINDFPLTLTIGSTETRDHLDAVVADIYISINGTQYSTTDVIDTDASQTFHFSDIGTDNVTMDPGSIINIVVKVKFKSQGANQTNYANGTTIYATVAATTENFEDADTGDNINDVSGTPNGETMQLFSKGITVTDFSSSRETSINDSGESINLTFSISFRVTAFGDTFYIPKTVVRDISSTSAGLTYLVQDSDGNTSTTVGAAASQLTSSTDTISGYFEVAEGDTETFHATIVVTKGTANTGYYRIQLNDLGFDTDQTGDVTPYTLTPSDNFNTDYSLIEG